MGNTPLDFRVSFFETDDLRLCLKFIGKGEIEFFENFRLRGLKESVESIHDSWIWKGYLSLLQLDLNYTLSNTLSRLIARRQTGGLFVSRNNLFSTLDKRKIVGIFV